MRYTKGVKGWGQRLVSKVTPKFCVVNGQTEKLTVKILTMVAVVTTVHMGPPLACGYGITVILQAMYLLLFAM